MNLYQIERKDTSIADDYDWDNMYLGAVVVAEDEEQARLIHPSGRQVPEEHWTADWCKPEDVEVTLLGVANSTKIGVVFNSYRNG
jgi:hypothetical protein